MAQGRGLRRHSSRGAAKPSVHILDGHGAQAFVKIFIVRRIASVAIVVVLAAACSGCALGSVGMVTTVAPAVAAGSGQLIGAQVAIKQDSGTAASKEESADKS